MQKHLMLGISMLERYCEQQNLKDLKKQISGTNTFRINQDDIKNVNNAL